MPSFSYGQNLYNQAPGNIRSKSYRSIAISTIRATTGLPLFTCSRAETPPSAACRGIPRVYVRQPGRNCTGACAEGQQTATMRRRNDSCIHIQCLHHIDCAAACNWLSIYIFGQCQCFCRFLRSLLLLLTWPRTRRRWQVRDKQEQR